MITIDRILCPIDFSDFSRRALDHAVALARWYHSKVIVVHAIAPAVFAPAPAPAVLDPRIYADVDPAQLLGRVDRFARDAAAPDVTMESMLRADDPATGILRAADDTRADLIVLGTHGRSGFERLLLGSVTEKVLRKATCPVLTVPRHQLEAAPAAAGASSSGSCVPSTSRRARCRRSTSPRRWRRRGTRISACCMCCPTRPTTCTIPKPQPGRHERRWPTTWGSGTPGPRNGSSTPCLPTRPSIAGSSRCWSAESPGARSCGSPRTATRT